MSGHWEERPNEEIALQHIRQRLDKLDNIPEMRLWKAVEELVKLPAYKAGHLKRQGRHSSPLTKRGILLKFHKFIPFS